MITRTVYMYDDQLEDAVLKTVTWKTVEDVTTEEALAWVTAEMRKDGITEEMPMIVDKYVELANYKYGA